MLSTVKGTSVKVSLTIIIALSILCWFLFKAYTGGLVDQGALQQNNVTLQQNVEHIQQSAVITDKVVSEYVSNVNDSKQQTETLRKEAVNDYINKVKPTAPVQSVGLPDGADRVIGLAHSMHENYCRARPKDTRCSPIDSGK